MTTRFWLVLASCLLILAGAHAAEPERSDYPIDEEAIYAEVARLQDTAGTPSDKQVEEADECLRKGVEAHDRRNYEKAIELYTKAVDATPTSALLYYERALTLGTMGRSLEALEDVVRSLALDPKQPLAHVLRGSLEDDLGFSERCLETYTRLLELDPDHYLGLINKAITHLKRGEYEEAERLLLHAVDTSPEKPSAYVHLASAARLRDFNYEEKEYLTRFLEVGSNDPRAAQVQTRLDELNRQDVTIDPTSPYAAIELPVALARSLWRSTQHRERNPDARGYRLTLEEEKAVVQELLLSMWRETKAEDPSASHQFYDLLLTIDDAGFFDEYVYTQKRNEIGAAAAEWIEANPERVEAFFGWAREQGLASDPEPEQEVESEASAAVDGEESEAVVLEEADLPGLVITIAVESELRYEIGAAKEPEEIRRAERKRWRKFKYDGDDPLDCKVDLRKVMESAIVNALPDFFRAARCSFPGDRQWRDLQMVSRLGRRFEDRDFPLLASVEEDGAEDIKVGVSETPAALSYAMTKAIWPREELIRRAFDAASTSGPSHMEEKAAMIVAMGAYRNSLQPDEGADPPAPDPYMEFVLEVAEAGYLDAFVAFEILHKQYGVSLERISPDLAHQLDAYLNGFVFPVVQEGLE